MANKEKLPWDLMEEILSHVHPTSLIRFKTVCKRWNTLFNNKAFINNHKKTFRFILATKSKIYSVSINPKIEVRELTLTLDIFGLDYEKPKSLVDSSGFLLCGMGKEAVVCNPWLIHTRCIKLKKVDQPSLTFLGIGYDNNSKGEEVVYKSLSEDFESSGIIHDFASDLWKYKAIYRKLIPFKIDVTQGVSLNGTLYWVAYYGKTDQRLFFIVNFNFSNEEFLEFCDLPCGKNHRRDALVLRVFREDKFSLLKQCHATKKINIWVTKNKIGSCYGQNVKWINFMEVSSPNLPSLVQTKFYSEPSYFIEDKKLVICSCDETGRAWIYVVVGNKLISKIQLDSVVEPWPLHCTYYPSLVLVPGGQREGAVDSV